MNEKRRFVRVDRTIRVKYQPAGSESAEGQGVSKNISVSGMCALLSDSFPVGTFLKLRFRLSRLSEPIETQAEVVWIDKRTAKGRKPEVDSEAGLRFTELSSAAKASIATFVYESLKRRKGN